MFVTTISVSLEKLRWPKNKNRNGQKRRIPIKFHFPDLHFDLPPPDTFLGQAVIVLHFTSVKALRDFCNKINDRKKTLRAQSVVVYRRMFVFLFLLALRKVEPSFVY